MDRLETLLSQTLVERADQAPTGPVPLVEPRHRARNTIALTAAVLIVITIATVVAVVQTSSPTRPSTQNSEPAWPNLPGGVRLASYGSVSLRVPDSLATRTSLCGTPVGNEVVADDGAARLCPVATNRLAAHPGTVVWFSSPQQATPYAGIPTSSAQIDGHTAERGYATDRQGLGDGISGVVVLPDQHITIGVTAPTRPQVDTVLSSIRIAELDPSGCAASLQSATTSPPGPTDVLVRANPIATVRCVYGTGTTVAGRLIGSYPLDRSQTTRLATALNALSPDPCHCVHGGTPAPGHDEVLYFYYPDSAALRINGALGANLDTYTNQQRTVANYSGSIGQLLAELTNQH